MFEKSQLYTFMGNKNILFAIFFLLIRSWPNFNIKYNLEWQKKRRVNEPFILDRKKLLCLKAEFWPIFSLKMGQKSKFKLNNFLCSNDKVLVNNSFFLSSQVVFYVKTCWRSYE